MAGGSGLAGRFTFDASVLEAIQAAVVVTDLEGVIIAANSRAAHFYGRAHDELIGCDSMVLRAGPIPEDVIAEVADAVMAGRTWEGEFTVVGPDGKPFGVHIIDAPAFDDEGRLIGIVGIGFDVTEYRLGRDELGRVLAGSRVLRGLVDSLAADGSAERIEYLIADAACRVTGAAKAVYYSLVSGADGHLVAEAVIGEPDGPVPGAVLEVGRLGLTGVFVRTDPLVIDDLADEAWRTSSLAVLGCDGSEPSGSVVLVPVHSRTGAGIGLMALGHPEPGFFSETDVSAVTSVCGQGAVALDLATMFREATAELEDRRRSEDAQRFLAAASETLASAFDAPRMYEEVARVCVPFLADYCTIDLAVPGGRTRRVATVHADPAVADIVAELDARHRALPTGSAMAVAVAHGGGGGVLADLSDDFLRRNTSDERHLELVRSLGFTSGMCVPLRARGRVLGALTLVSAGSGRVFGAEDLAIAEDYGRRAALAVDNARLYAERDHTARALQAGLLPTTLPRIRGASVAARYLAAGEQTEVGGDFYDAFLADDGAAWVLIGDVSGKGPEAAAVVGLARHTLRALGRRERLPRRLLADLHEALLLEDRGEYCTVCCGRLVREPDGGAVLTIAAAGHPPPVLRRAGGRIERTSCSGTLVGMPIGIRFDEQVIRLGPGDAVVFHTDGVTEERDATGEEFGDVRLARAIRTAGSGAGAIADNVVETVRGHGTGEPRDDVAVLVVEIEEDA